MNDNATSEITLSSASEHHEQTLKLIESANREICIHSHDLTNRIYNHPDLASALSKFVTANSAKRSIKIIVNDVNAIISSDHKILDVCRRLSSNVSIRKISKEHENHTESFLLVDGSSYIFRSDYTLLEGVLSHNPKQAKVLLNLFNEFWSHSEPDSSLNRLYI